MQLINICVRSKLPIGYRIPVRDDYDHFAARDKGEPVRRTLNYSRWFKVTNSLQMFHLLPFVSIVQDEPITLRPSMVVGSVTSTFL